MRIKLQIILLLVFLVSITSASENKNLIVVYEDEGASLQAINNIKYSLKELVFDTYEIKGIKAIDIKEGIDPRTVLFVMPGGRATPYRQKLYEENDSAGNKEIKRFVNEGGCYLGLGAGAYYAGSKVLFSQNHPESNQRIAVEKEKLLCFFSGPVIGPVFEPFVYNSHKGAKAANIIFNSEVNEKLNVVPIYYNGGGYFDISNNSDVKVVGYYDNTPHDPAIIKCQVGRGSVMLSGVHPEYTHELINTIILSDELENEERQYLMNINSSITQENCNDVLKFILSDLLISIK